MLKSNHREYWIDNVKLIAIVLVVLGHFYQSMVKSSFLPYSNFYNYFIYTIYLFHVQLFFMCSGYLYQKRTKTDNFKQYGKNIYKKILALGIPYFVFTIATYSLKYVFNSSVNNQNEDGLLNVFFVNPIPPYWFLYCLFLLFLVTPVLKNKTLCVVRFLVSIALYMCVNIFDVSFLPDILKSFVLYICIYQFWFILGMMIDYFDLKRFLKTKYFAFFIIFIVLTVLVFNTKTENFVVDVLLSLIAVICVCSLCYGVSKNKTQPKLLSFVSKYTMPIFLMHTICAAGCRGILNKIGVTNSIIHIVIGLISSFVLPVIIAMIMEKIKLDFLYNPTKYIKTKART